MEFDFKITTWERVTVSKENEAKVLQALKNNEINSANDIYNLLEEDSNIHCDTLLDVSEQMYVEDNGGSATIEVFENGEMLFNNSKN